MDTSWLPKRTVLTLDDQDGNSFAIVVTTDDSLGITRNNDPLPSYCWPADQMDHCVRELLRLTRRGTRN